MRKKKITLGEIYKANMFEDGHKKGTCFYFKIVDLQAHPRTLNTIYLGKKIGVCIDDYCQCFWFDEYGVCEFIKDEFNDIEFHLVKKVNLKSSHGAMRLEY